MLAEATSEHHSSLPHLNTDPTELAFEIDSVTEIYHPELEREYSFL
jgi:hypothetical protein